MFCQRQIRFGWLCSFCFIYINVAPVTKVFSAEDKLPRGRSLSGSNPGINKELKEQLPENKVGRKSNKNNLDSKSLRTSPPPKPNFNGGTNKSSLSDCGRIFFNYPGRLMTFSSDNKKSYHLLQKPEVAISDYKLKNKVAERYSEFYQYDYVKNELLLLKKANFPKTDAIFTQGENPHNFVLLSFTGEEALCMTGEAQVFQLPVLKEGNSFQMASGQYTLAQSANQAYLLYDLLVNQAVDVDPKFFQFRKDSVPLEKGLRPLYLPTTRNQPIIAVKSNKNSRYHEIVRFHPEAVKKNILNIPKSERIIYDNGLIGSVKIDEKNNALILREIQDWSGAQSKLRSFKITLPKDTPVSSATVRADFARRRIIILGMSEVFRRVWLKAFLVDYNTEAIKVMPLEPGRGNFLSEVEFHPGGELVIGQIQDINSGAPVGLLFYNTGDHKSFVMNFKNAKDIRDEMRPASKKEK